MTTAQQTSMATLVQAAADLLNEIFNEQEYSQGFKGAFENTSGRGFDDVNFYREIQVPVMAMLKGMRTIANELNEYFDSDAGLANEIIYRLQEEMNIAA